VLKYLNRKITAAIWHWRRAFASPPEFGLKSSAPERYHHWFFNNEINWTLGIFGCPIVKSPTDLWNYLEILHDLDAQLVVEFGTLAGGSALFFKMVLSQLHKDFRILTVDIDHSGVAAPVRRDPNIELLTASSTAPEVAARIAELRRRYPGPAFFILDSDHTAPHVLAELKLLRGVTRRGDYVVVEDGDINGHPVRPDAGPGPYEAIEAYEREHAGDYVHDRKREAKFGFTCAPNGYLKRV
jgi:cephalosporin hydroxylase